MRKQFNNILKGYGNFVSNRPFVVITIVIIAVIVSLQLASSINQKGMDQEDSLPENIETIEAFEVIEDNFGGSESAMIAIELNPTIVGSNEPRDIRNPEIMEYTAVLTELVSTMEEVQEANSAGKIFRQINKGIVPQSKNKIIQLYEDNPMFKQFISSDFELTIVRLTLTGDYDDAELVEELNNIIKQTKKPAGIEVEPAGNPVISPVITKQLGPDQQKTTQFSLIAIVIILIFMLRSVRFAVAPLITIGVGVVLAFGYIGLIGMNISPATSGVISMIMGIGIDFGIQTVSRFRQELERNKSIENAMSVTFTKIFVPMATTTLAALIGFQAMTMGKLSFIGELGQIMSYGVTACFVAAITILPAIVVIFEKVNVKTQKKFNAIYAKLKPGGE